MRSSIVTALHFLPQLLMIPGPRPDSGSGGSVSLLISDPWVGRLGPDDIGQLTREAGWVARVFAECQRRAAAKLVTSSVSETLRGKPTRTSTPREHRTLVGKEHRAVKARLGLTEGPDVSQHLPGFFFRQHKRNKGGHRRSLAAVFENPEELAVGSSCLPTLVRKVSRQRPF